MQEMASTPGLDVLELGLYVCGELAAQSVHCYFLTTNNTNQTNVEVCWIKIRVIRSIRLPAGLAIQVS